MEREQQDWIARSARRRVSLSGTVQRADANDVRVLVTDISYLGCKILSDTLFQTGELLAVTVPGLGTVNAQVRWTGGDMAGLTFLVGSSVQEERRARLGV